MKKLVFLTILLVGCAHTKSSVKDEVMGSCRYTCKILTNKFLKLGLISDPDFRFEIVMANGESCTCSNKDL